MISDQKTVSNMVSEGRQDRTTQPQTYIHCDLLTEPAKRPVKVNIYGLIYFRCLFQDGFKSDAPLTLISHCQHK